MKTTLLLGTVWLGVACSSEGTTPKQSGRPGGDSFGVRIAGGEASDFGNGSEDPCGPSSVDIVLTEQDAEQAGLDVEADRAWLALPHIVALRWNPVECESDPGLCEPTELELQAQVVEPILVKGKHSRPSADCPAEWQSFAYRVAVTLESEDGNLAGTFYARVSRNESEDGVVSVAGIARPHLWNLEGQLPLEFDLARSHYAYLGIELSLASDGSASGRLKPSVLYYAPPSTDGTDGGGGAAGAASDDDESWRHTTERIGPDALFGTRKAPFDVDSVLALDAERSTLTTYPGSMVAPVVDLSVKTYAFEHEEDVDLKIWVEGEQVYDQSVAAGTRVELGQHPFGTPVVVDVDNSNGAGKLSASIVQRECGGASSECTGHDCTVHLEYTAEHHHCSLTDGPPEL